jgi:ABC-type oligopeptide transport system ATPase subunit
MTALVVAEHLTRHFSAGGLRRAPPVQAITDVTLAIEQGESVALVGESGSGKTTLGRLLLGLLTPTAGHVTFDGIDLARAKRGEIRRRMQIVFQDPQSSLDPRRPVGSQIADGLEIHNIVPKAERRARVEALLAQVGLPPAHADRYPHEFSGGQRQRIGIARALATGPDFLVADEPVSALDVSVQAQVLNLLQDLQEEFGMSYIFISHDLSVVKYLADQVMVMHQGKVVELANSDELYHNPTHAYTRQLLSAIPRGLQN